ncbi:MAG: KOW domain-containing RNA-binding protein [Clostridia bacterium]|nr:KOW domain-containing RNA-binding protein [Clostridia bacterium]MBC7346154.1 KOW domain-containing RNA-binding protein [Clostridia bacterium]
MRVGQLVLSKAGRDRGRPLLVLKVAGDGYAYVADGELRRVARPKRKNVKHLQPTGRIARDMAAKLEAGKLPTDAEIRKALAALTEGERQSDPRGEEEGDGEKGCD